MLLRPTHRVWSRDWKIISAYLFGTTCGALITTGSLWMLGGFSEPLSPTVRVVLLIVGTLTILIIKHGALATAILLPESKRQIPAEVFSANLVKGAYYFGFELGTGVRTYVPSSTPYVLLIAILLVPFTVWQAILIAVGFGIGRAIPLIVYYANFSEVDPRLMHKQEISHPLQTVLGSPLIVLGALCLA